MLDKSGNTRTMMFFSYRIRFYQNQLCRLTLQDLRCDLIKNPIMKWWVSETEFETLHEKEGQEYIFIMFIDLNKSVMVISVKNYGIIQEYVHLTKTKYEWRSKSDDEATCVTFHIIRKLFYMIYTHESHHNQLILEIISKKDEYDSWEFYQRICNIRTYWFLHVVNHQEIIMISWHGHVSYEILD